MFGKPLMARYAGAPALVAVLFALAAQAQAAQTPAGQTTAGKTPAGKSAGREPAPPPTVVKTFSTTPSSSTRSSSTPSSTVRPTIGAGAVAAKCTDRSKCAPATYVTTNWKAPQFKPDPEPAATETLADALYAAYHTAPTLQAQRYQARAYDEDYAQALAEMRPTTQVQVAGNFSRTVQGRTSQANSFSTSDIVTNKLVTATASITQPLYTGGKASADREAALAQIDAGREQLRGAEGDLLLQVITAYADIRRDEAILRLRAANLKQLQATFNEVQARRRAGELTRTDVGLAETQLHSAQSLYNSSEQQLQQDRATYAALVGHDAGVLAPPPQLPNLPGSAGAALDLAQNLSPDMAQAIAVERESRAQIGAAKAQGRPTVTLTGNATLTGQALPYYLRNQDQVFEGRAVLTIPLTNGGRVGSLVAQAQDRNAADRMGVEATQRQMVVNIVNAWNALATAERNIQVSNRQVSAARTYDQGTFEEYRAGLRSTFDVLYAHGSLRDAEINLVAARHDLYVAEATLLRRVGLLEARSLLNGSSLYDPQANLRRAARRGAMPWDPLVRAVDTVGRPRGKPLAPQTTASAKDKPALKAPKEAPERDVSQLVTATPARKATPAVTSSKPVKTK